tara:strand:- start:13824 stop:14240 length:417 start_codon:yes stop_codon:yes gene_type:complete
MTPFVNADDETTWPKDIIIPLEEPFSDDRGVIQNLLEGKIGSAVLITSKKGSVRANHYHETDWHFCHVQEGEIEYFHRTVGSDNPPEMLTIKTGEMFFTPPMVEHAMRFTKDTTFLTLARNARNPEAYESDVIRVNLI